MRYKQAGLNSGFTNLRAKSPNLNFEKARIKKLGFKVMKVIKSSYYQHLLQDITTNQQLSRRMPPKTTSFNRADHGVRDYYRSCENSGMSVLKILWARRGSKRQEKENRSHKVLSNAFPDRQLQETS